MGDTLLSRWLAVGGTCRTARADGCGCRRLYSVSIAHGVLRVGEGAATASRRGLCEASSQGCWRCATAGGVAGSGVPEWGFMTITRQ